MEEKKQTWMWKEKKTSNNADKTHKYTNSASLSAVPFDHKEDGKPGVSDLFW